MSHPGSTGPRRTTGDATVRPTSKTSKCWPGSSLFTACSCCTEPASHRQGHGITSRPPLYSVLIIVLYNKQLSTILIYLGVLDVSVIYIFYIYKYIFLVCLFLLLFSYLQLNNFLENDYNFPVIYVLSSASGNGLHLILFSSFIVI